MNTFRPKPHALQAIFGRRKVVIGMIHSRALPGSPAYEGEPMDDVVGFAVAEAVRLRQGGVDGLIVENHGDIPFARPDQLGPETAACMAVMTDAVRRAAGLPVGVNVLANGAHQAIAVAKASGAAFVRVNQWANAYVSNEGLLDGLAGRPPATAPSCTPAACACSPTCMSSTARTPSPPTGPSRNWRATWSSSTRTSPSQPASAPATRPSAAKSR